MPFKLNHIVKCSYGIGRITRIVKSEKGSPIVHLRVTRNCTIKVSQSNLISPNWVEWSDFIETSAGWDARRD